MSEDKPDWVRLQKALSFETENGFNDIVGKQYRFSEFLHMSLSLPPATLIPADRRRWEALSAEFARYPELSLEQRQDLVRDTRRFLLDMERVWQHQETQKGDREHRSRGAGEQGSRGAGEQGSRGAGEQGSRGAGEQGSRGAGEQGSRGAGEQGSRGVRASPQPPTPNNPELHLWAMAALVLRLVLMNR